MLIIRIVNLFLFCILSTLALSQSPVVKTNQRKDSLVINESDSLSKILNQQKVLINEFNEIKEDILAEKVFEKSKSRIINWVTFGGLFLLLVGVFGFWKINDIVKENVKKKIGEISQDQLFKEIRNQSNEYVEKVITEKVSTLDLSNIASQIREQGQTSLEELVLRGTDQFDIFVTKKKEEIEGLVIQLKRSIDALNNPLGAPEKTKKRRVAKEENASTDVDYSADMMAVRDTGEEGSIVGFAVAYSVEYQIYKQHQKHIRISPRQIYYYARINSNLDIKEDNGAFIKGGVKSVHQTGAIDEKEWPYKAGEFNKKPPASEKNATHYKVKEIFPIKNLQEIKDSIRSYGPIVIGITVFESMYSDEHSNEDGVLRMPKEKESINGAIAVCIVGFDDKTKLFKFIHYWGKQWGDKGFGYVPYEYVQKYSDDGWALNDISI